MWFKHCYWVTKLVGHCESDIKANTRQHKTKIKRKGKGQTLMKSNPSICQKLINLFLTYEVIILKTWYFSFKQTQPFFSSKQGPGNTNTTQIEKRTYKIQRHLQVQRTPYTRRKKVCKYIRILINHEQISHLRIINIYVVVQLYLEDQCGIRKGEK